MVLVIELADRLRLADAGHADDGASAEYLSGESVATGGGFRLIWLLGIAVLLVLTLIVFRGLRLSRLVE